MTINLVIGLAALIALLPSALLTVRGRAGRRDPIYWVLLAVAVAGQVAWAVVVFRDHWQTGVAAALSVSVAATVVVFVAVVAVSRQGWRLTPIVMPYLIVLGLFGLALQGIAGRPLLGAAIDPWLGAHIGISVAAYAVLTLAAIAGLGVIAQERALKRKRPTALTRLLPSVADGEALQVGLLAVCEGVLLLGILTGIAIRYRATGDITDIDHKTLFSLLAFVVVGLLLAAHYRAGIRGRGAARWVLAAYLLLTLAYPGVKFVTDVLASAD
jgi:ABC-type uncharacterized transport system permease subunit